MIACRHWAGPACMHTKRVRFVSVLLLPPRSQPEQVKGAFHLMCTLYPACPCVRAAPGCACNHVCMHMQLRRAPMSVHLACQPRTPGCAHALSCICAGMAACDRGRPAGLLPGQRGDGAERERDASWRDHVFPGRSLLWVPDAAQLHQGAPVGSVLLREGVRSAPLELVTVYSSGLRCPAVACSPACRVAGHPEGSLPPRLCARQKGDLKLCQCVCAGKAQPGQSAPKKLPAWLTNVRTNVSCMPSRWCSWRGRSSSWRVRFERGRRAAVW